jgi:hypothetical protein
VDFQAEPGTPCARPLAGTVQSVDFGLQGGSVTITAGNVQVTLRGLAQVLVQPGDLAAAGDALGTAARGALSGRAFAADDRRRKYRPCAYLP